MAELITESKQKKTGNGVFLHTPVTLYAVHDTGKEVKCLSCRKENLERKKKKGYLGISFNVTSYSMFTFLFFSISYFFMGSVASPVDTPRSTMPLSCIVRVALRVQQLQNIKRKKESPSTPSSFLKKAIDVA